MRRHSKLLFFFIGIIALVAFLINIPPVIRIDIDTPRLPLINRSISVHKTFPGINTKFSLGPIKFERDLAFRKGLDLEGGTSITLRANMAEISGDRRDDALDSAREVIERRINFFGVSEPVIQTAKTNNDYRIIVEIPGITDVNQAVRLIGTTAKLTFWEVAATGSAQLASPSAYPQNIALFMQNPVQTDLTGGDLKQSSVVFDPNTGVPQVQLNFNGDGARKFAVITRRNVGKPLAMVLDNQLLSAPPPTVEAAITGGNAVITGNFTTEEAKALSVQLNAGALPVSLSVLEQHSIGATLGNQSLQKSLFAGAIGFIVIVIFMSFLYGRLGIIASAALIVYVLLVLSLFRLIPITLTLAGIAGFILSIGIAVDANILIFDRTIEEMRRGRSRESALDVGFRRAWTSIRDSNVASLITSVILYYFGTGIVRGFALTLALGVIVSMFSAITVTRTLLNVFYKNK